MDPYQLLVDIERNSKTYANSIPQQVILERDWRGFCFQLSDINFVAPLSEVLEVLAMPSLSPLAASKPWFLGICNLRGRLLPVTDLQGFVSDVSHRKGKENRILVKEFDGKNFGFLVERVLGIKRFFSKDIKTGENMEFKKPEIEKYLPYLSGFFQDETRVFYILNLSSIIKTNKFYHITISGSNI